MKPALLQPAYVLHQRQYRESSLLVELFTRDYGRISVIAKGARRKTSQAHGLLRPFLPLLISWSGKHELKTLTHSEVSIGTQLAFANLQKECLFAGFYLNELLMYLLQKWDAHPNLFTIYANTVTELQKPTLQQITLRRFEKKLLDEIGYGLMQSFLPDQYYRFVPEHGFVVEKINPNVNHRDLFSGKNLIAIAKEEWREDNLFDAKRLMRILLSPLLGTKTIYSRQLFTVFV